MTSITIPDSVTSIGDYAFYSCYGLTSITIPDSVTSIGNYAFDGCSGLTDVYYTGTEEEWAVIEVGDYNSDLLYATVHYNHSTNQVSFTVTADNRSMTGYRGAKDENLVIPAVFQYDGVWYRVTAIGDSAFSGCTGLTSITIPDSVTSIGEYAFYNCTGLTSITIPDSVTSIGNYAFDGCSGLTDVYYTGTEEEWAVIEVGDYNSDLLYATVHYNYSTNQVSFTVTADNRSMIGYRGAKDENLVIPAVFQYDGVWYRVTAIGNSAFSGCTRLTTITIPDSVTSIGERAFRSCYDLTSITIPDSVTSIDQEAFCYCTGLTSITIPDSVTSIGGWAFYGCSGLTSITIPDSVTSIGRYVFEGCANLTAIAVAEGNSVYHSDGNCLIATASNTLLMGCKNSIIPSDGSITSIDDGAFSSCYGLISIEIPNSVLSIGTAAFANCIGLTSITIPDSVTSIDENTFTGCSNLTSITIPNGVTSIGDNAFHACSMLTDVYFSGTEERWEAILWGNGNATIQDATIHYNYVPVEQ